MHRPPDSAQPHLYFCVPSPLVYVLVPEEATSNFQSICCTEVQQSHQCLSRALCLKGPDLIPTIHHAVNLFNVQLLIDSYHMPTY